MNHKKNKLDLIKICIYFFFHSRKKLTKNNKNFKLNFNFSTYGSIEWSLNIFLCFSITSKNRCLVVLEESLSFHIFLWTPVSFSLSNHEFYLFFQDLKRIQIAHLWSSHESMVAFTISIFFLSAHFDH